MDDKLLKEDLELDVVDSEDEVAFALNNYLEDEENTAASIVKKYPEETSGYNSHIYENLEDNSEWLVCTREEADEYAQEDLESLVDDVGPVEAFGYSTVSYYLSDSYFDEMMEEDIRWQVDDMDDEDLIEELESYHLIDEDDMVPDEDWEPDEEADETEEDRPMIYPERLLEDKKEELIERKMDEYGNSVEWFESMYGENELEEYIKDNPDCVDLEGLIRDIIDNEGPGDWLAHYDGREHEFSYEDEDGHTIWLYAYRID